MSRSRDKDTTFTSPPLLPRIPHQPVSGGAAVPAIRTLVPEAGGGMCRVADRAALLFVPDKPLQEREHERACLTLHMNTHELTADAKAILLLCGRFGKGDDAHLVRPLELGDYNSLAEWLHGKKCRPADLLEASDVVRFLRNGPAVDPEQVATLLKRGAALAFAVEKWFNNGIWVVCRSDAVYPARLKEHLKKQAPPILFGAGDLRLFSRGGLAVVGSRAVDAEALAFTKQVGCHCAKHDVQVVSGGARGVDEAAMLGALDAGGTVVGVLAERLAAAAVSGKYREALRADRLVLVSACHPETAFNVGNAMGRNKYIYSLAEFALAVCSDYKKGGTWAGAEEELRRPNAVPVYVRITPGAPKGNLELIKLGAREFPERAMVESPVKVLTRLPAAPVVTHKPEDDPALPLFKYVPEPSHANALMVHDADSHDAAPPPAPSSGNAADRLYQAVLPVILDALSEGKSCDQLAAELNVRKVQLEDWLKLAIKDGKVKKKQNPVRYVRVSITPELPLKIGNKPE